MFDYHRVRAKQLSPLLYALDDYDVSMQGAIDNASMQELSKKKGVAWVTKERIGYSLNIA